MYMEGQFSGQWPQRPNKSERTKNPNLKYGTDGQFLKQKGDSLSLPSSFGSIIARPALQKKSQQQLTVHLNS
jgi:hypothetical protein